MGKALVPFAFVFTPSLLLIGFDLAQFIVGLTGIVVAIAGLGAAYTGYCGRPIGRSAFVALNLLSLPLIFGHLGTTVVCSVGVIAILAWHGRPDASTNVGSAPV